MKTYKLLIASALALQAASFGAIASGASPFPSAADAESLPAQESRAERYARMEGNDATWGVSPREAHEGFPSSGDVTFLPAQESRAERYVRMGIGDETWGVSRRQPHDPFPFDNSKD
ncbi:MAG TPA: hypothetical protein VD867_15750 [Burkholderiales bacterium]|nr:hypothetical protein [Burkholderiales bacterium]